MQITHFVWIDWLKAIGIILVVLGHTVGNTTLTSFWIYSFHMPLFFSISGFLLPIISHMSWKDFIYKRLSKLFLAYLLFALLGGLFGILFAQFSQSVHMPLSTAVTCAAEALLYSSGTITSNLKINPLALWFFPALIIGQILTFGILRLPSRLRVSAVAACMAAAYLMRNLALPWETESAFAAVPFLFVGYALRCREHWQEFLSALNPLVIALLFISGSAIGIKYGLRDLRSSSFGNPLLACLSSGILILSITAIAMKLPRLKGITYIANASIVIFSIQPLLFIIIDSVAKRFPGVPQVLITESVPYAIFKCLTTFLFLLAAYPFFLSHIPISWTQQAKANRDIIYNKSISSRAYCIIIFRDYG